MQTVPCWILVGLIDVLNLRGKKKILKKLSPSFFQTKKLLSEPVLHSGILIQAAEPATRGHHESSAESVCQLCLRIRVSEMSTISADLPVSTLSAEQA